MTNTVRLDFVVATHTAVNELLYFTISWERRFHGTLNETVDVDVELVQR